MISDVMPTYASIDLAFERGEGPYLFTEDGRRFLDFGSGIAVNSLGHCHPALIQTLSDQSEKLWHCSNLYRIPIQEKLAGKLTANSFADSVFFCNSGAEAVEAGLKLVRRYQSYSGRPERFRVITFDGSFHGRTLATISAAANDAHKAGFGPMVNGFDIVPFGNLEQVRAAVTKETAAILVEPIQGEGGIRPAEREFLPYLRELCDEFDLLLFLDEVQTGIGRTGHLFAHQGADVNPDVIAIAKGLGGGFPVGACLASAKAAAGMTAGTHGSTFGGNPLAMSVACKVLDIIKEEGLLKKCVELGVELRTRITKCYRNYPNLVEEVRGAGLMVGIKAIVPAGELVTAFRDHGLLTVPAGDNVVRLLPPLIIDQNHVEEALEMISSAFKALT